MKTKKKINCLHMPLPYGRRKGNTIISKLISCFLQIMLMHPSFKPTGDLMIGKIEVNNFKRKTQQLPTSDFP